MVLNLKHRKRRLSKRRRVETLALLQALGPCSKGARANEKDWQQQSRRGAMKSSWRRQRNMDCQRMSWTIMDSQRTIRKDGGDRSVWVQGPGVTRSLSDVSQD